MEKQPSFSRIIGGNEKQKEALTQKASERTELSGEEIFGDDLDYPTEEEKKLIEKSSAYVNEMAAYYGSDRVIDPNRVFVLKEGGVKRYTDGSAAGGVFNRLTQAIGVDKKASPILFAETIIHEGFHAASYSSGQIINDGTDRPYRQGVSMRGRSEEGTYFK